MGLARFEIDVRPGTEKAVVNGQELEPSRISLDARHGQVPQLYLEFSSETVISGEGIVQVGHDQDLRQAVLEFLGSLDPGLVEAAALERMGGFGGDETTGQAFLNVLKEMVRGDDDGS